MRVVDLIARPQILDPAADGRHHTSSLVTESNDNSKRSSSDAQ
jgi:hypothetical protein